MLIDYARSGSYDHIRAFITSDLAHSATAGDTILLPFFKGGLGDPVRGYWSILEYIRVAEGNTYHDLVGLLLDTRLPLNQRAHGAFRSVIGAAQSTPGLTAPNQPFP